MNAELTLTKLQVEARKGRSLEESCQALMEHFQAAFADSIVLARTYATISYDRLPAPDLAFVKATVDGRGVGDLLEEKTPVLSLMGTAGVLPRWRQRYESRGHLAIPLLSIVLNQSSNDRGNDEPLPRDESTARAKM